MLPLNTNKPMFSAEEATVIKFALNIFLQTDFSGLTSKKEEADAKKYAKLSFDKLHHNVNEFAFKELCVMAGAIDNLISLFDEGETFKLNETQITNCKYFLPSAKQKLIELIQ